MASGIRHVAVEGVQIVRHAVDQVGNNLTARLEWCSTHVEPVWVYGDGSFSCPHDLVVGWSPDEHVITEGPWAIDLAAERALADQLMNACTGDDIDEWVAALAAWRERRGK